MGVILNPSKKTSKYYWDSCIWIDLIQRIESERIRSIEFVFELVQRGEAQLNTSAITLAEVFKDDPKHGDRLELSSGEDISFEDYIDRYVTVLNVTQAVGIIARDLQKNHSRLAQGGCGDAIHVACCLYYNIQVLHTFDGGLLSLNQKLECSNGKKLIICKPQPPGKQLEL